MMPGMPVGIMLAFGAYKICIHHSQISGHNLFKTPCVCGALLERLHGFIGGYRADIISQIIAVTAVWAKVHKRRNCDIYPCAMPCVGTGNW